MVFGPPSQDKEISRTIYVYMFCNRAIGTSQKKGGVIDSSRGVPATTPSCLYLHVILGDSIVYRRKKNNRRLNVGLHDAASMMSSMMEWATSERAAFSYICSWEPFPMLLK